MSIDLRPYQAGINAAFQSIPTLCQDPRSEALGVVQSMGGVTNSILVSERVQRIKGDRCRGQEKDFWYSYREFEDTYNNGHMIGYMNYGYWKDVSTFQWSSRSETAMSGVERESYRAAMEAAKMQYEQEKLIRQSEAAEYALTEWQEAAPCVDHVYLANKGVTTTTGLKIAKDGRLIIPIAIGDKISSLQYINDTGEKRFLTGGALKGGYFVIKGEEDVIYIAEGYSTGASVWAATGKTVYIAFNAGNLYEVTSYSRNTWPNARIIIAGDDDTETTGNAGRTKAEQAASGLRIECIFPTGFVDFNDMHHEQGIAALREYLVPSNLEVYEKAFIAESDTFDRPNGILGDLFDYYNATSGNEQHGFALMTALGITSITSGRNFKSNLNNYTSLYLLCVGKSATGKEHIKTVTEKVLDEAGIGFYIAGDGYTSGGAVYSTLLDRPKHYAVIDELGRYLEASRGNSGSPHQREANTKIMEAFGRCHGTMRPLNYSTMTSKKADADAMKNRLIQNPALNIMSMTTPSTLFATLDIGAIEDGFVNRFIVSISHAERARRVHKEDLDVPQRIIDWIRTVHERSNTPNIATQKADPILMTFTRDAMEVSYLFEDWCLNMANKLEKYGMGELPMRSNEISLRVAMNHALGLDPMAVTIGEESMIWATNFIKTIMSREMDVLKVTLSGSDYESNKKEILSDLRSRGSTGLTWSQMIKTPPYSRHKRNDLREIMEALKDADLACDETVVTQKRGKPAVKWVALK